MAITMSRSDRRPDIEKRNADEIRFSDAGSLLFKLAGCSHAGSCS